VGSFRKQRDRICEVPACGFDERKACEDEQCNEQPTIAGPMRVTMRAVAVTVVARTTASMPPPMPVCMLVLTIVSGMRSVASVLVLAVMIVRVWHEVGKPVSGYILETL